MTWVNVIQGSELRRQYPWGLDNLDCWLIILSVVTWCIQGCRNQISCQNMSAPGAFVGSEAGALAKILP